MVSGRAAEHDRTCSQAGKSTLPYYFIGIATLLTYLPLYWWRKKIEDKREPEAQPMAMPASGVSEPTA